MLSTKNLEVKPLRERLHLTQDELARIVGSSWVTVSRWERGLSEPSTEVENKLDGFPPSDLLQSGYS